MDNQTLIMKPAPLWVVDLIGKRSGKLYIENYLGFRNGRYVMRCVCDCGETTKSQAQHLKHGASRSCGCARKATLRRIKTKHGFAPYHGKKPRVYRSWQAMLRRCRSSKDSHYAHYGGRGITVCERWLQFENFLADMGEPPVGHSIERKDNDGNYEPGNCIWATRSVQAVNQRSNWQVLFSGEVMTVAEATRKAGLKPNRIYKFLYRQSASKAMVIPVDDFVASVRA